MEQKVLITGGAGFIGHHVVRYLLDNTMWNITLLDRLDESGNLNRLQEIFGASESKRLRFVWHDLRAPVSQQVAAQIGYDWDYVLHLAAATHVDRSIQDPLAFVYDNVVATCNLLTFLQKAGVNGKIIYFSTDEVFGPAPAGIKYKEWDRYKSGNPYAATKAGAEELCLAFHNTFGMPILITHTMNVFGPRQHPEKFIPMTVQKVDRGDVVTIHADKTLKVAGSRYYIWAGDVADALVFLLKRGHTGDKYNIVGIREMDNLLLAQAIADIMGKQLKYQMVDFHSSRPGHDLRYALDGKKMAEMSWLPQSDFIGKLSETVSFTLKNRQWL